MYYFKREFRQELLRGDTITKMANFLGITPKYLGDIIAGRTGCAKKTALLITVNMDPNAEIEKYFIMLEE